MPEVTVTVVKIDRRDDAAADMVEGLVAGPGFSMAAGPEDVGGGERGWRITVGNVETDDAARKAIVESLGDITPVWRKHLRVADG